MIARAFSSRRGAMGAVICMMLCLAMLFGLATVMQTDAYAADTAPDDITVFEANQYTNVASFYNSATLNKIYSGALDARDGIALVGISRDTGDIEMLSSSGLSYTYAISDGYDYYLQLKNFESFMTSVAFGFNANTMNALGIRQTEDVNGQRSWDLSMYRGIEIEFYVPSDVYGDDATYGFLVRIDCGSTADGWAYYMRSLETKGSYFTENDGFYTYSDEIANMKLARCPDMAAVNSVIINFSEWKSMVGVNKTGNAADGYAVYVKSVKFVDAVPSETEGWCGENVSWALDGSGTLSISGSGAMSYYSEYQRYPWYPYRSSIKNVVIGEGVTSIGDHAFSDFGNMKSVVIPGSVESIGASAFSGCDSLVSITVPDSVKSIGVHAFSDCDALSRVYISDVAAWCSIDFGNEYSNPLFYARNLYINGRSVTDVVIPGGVTGIGAYAFYNCRSVKNVTIPKSVTSIGRDAFRCCNKLAGAFISDVAAWCAIDFENEYSNPSYYANLYLNREQMNKLTVPAGVTSISAYAFYKCNLFGSVTIPASVTSIGEDAFYGCSSLINVTVDSESIVCGITSSSAFGYLVNNASTVIIRADIDDIGSYITDNFTNIGNVVLDGVEHDIYSKHSQGDDGKGWTIWGGKCGNTLNWSLDSTGTLKITGGGEMSYCSLYQNYPWYPYRESIKRIVIGDGVTGIGNFAFSDCINLTSVSIGNAVKTLRANMFYNSRRNLESITVSKNNNNYHSDGNCVINTESKTLILGCKNSVIPSDGSVTCIGDHAFYKCSYGFASIIIPESVTSIGENTFEDCSSLKLVIINSAKIASGITSSTSCGYLANYATTVVVRADITSVGGYITSKFTSVNTVIIDGVQYKAYSKHAHGANSEGWSITENGEKICPDCGLEFSRIIASGTCGENLTWVLDCDWVLTISGSGKMTDWYISSNVPWYSYRDSIKSVVIEDGVESIGVSAFEACNSLTSVTMSDSVTSICNYAFSYCRSIDSVTIGKGVTSIGDWAFGYCSYLASVTIPNNVTSIGIMAFRDCSTLTSITIPDGVTGIGRSAFLNCSDLVSITVPDSVTYMGWKAFLGTGYYNDEENWENGVLYIGKWLINAKTTISGSYTIKDGTLLADGAFYECSKLTGVTLPNSVTSIGMYTFSGCGNLKSITIPNSVTSIEGEAFSGCSRLKLVIIDSADVASGIISSDACGWLAYYATTVVVRADITNVGSYITSNFACVDSVMIGGVEYKVYSKHAHSENSTNWTVTEDGHKVCSECGLTVDPEGIKWSFDEVTGTLTVSGFGAMDDYSSKNMPWYGIAADIKKVVICEGVTSIGKNAFNSEKAGFVFGEIELPSTLTSIGDYAFYKCASLTKIGVPASVKTIGAFAFRKCGLVDITFEGDNGWRIGEEGTFKFANKTALIEALVNRHHSKVWTTVEGGTDVTVIVAIGSCGKNVIWTLDDAYVLRITGTGDMYNYGAGNAPWVSYKNAIKGVIIGEGVTSIGNCAFYGCTKLSDAVISSSVKTIGRYAFRKAKLTDITFEGDNGWMIGDGTFAFGNSTAAIEALLRRFYDNAWTAVDAPEEAVIALGKCGDDIIWMLYDTGKLSLSGTGAMYDYGTNGAPWASYKDNVNSVVIGDGVTSIGNSSFYGCAGITSVSLPSSLVSVGNYAFYGCKQLADVTVPASVGTIGKYAFRKVGLKSITLECGNRWDIEGEVVRFASEDEAIKALISGYYTKVWTVYIAPPVSGVTVSDASVTLTEGDDVLVSADVQPEEADDRSVIWSSADSSVATVDGGRIVAVGVGETDITVTTVDGGYTATVHVKVLARHISVSDVSLDTDAVELEKGASMTVVATVLPSNATDKSLIWSSSDESVVTVSGGVITAVGGGNATVTVTTVDGGYTAVVNVTVIRRGDLSGRVYSASGRELLSGVSVKLYKDGSFVGSAVSDSTGNYGFSDVLYGAYEVIYSLDGYLDYDLAYTVASENAQIENIYLALDASRLPGYASGYAKNATTGIGISDITVYVRGGSGNTTGEVLQTLTTNSSGYYITDGLSAGNYTLQFVDERSAEIPFNTSSINVTVSGNETSAENNISLVQPGDYEFRVVLTWGETPYDLDSHLLISSGSDEYHVYYHDKTPSGAGANLDVDDTTSYGPETVTVTSIKADGVYRYYVHNYTDRNNSSSDRLTNSGAVVNIYIGGEVHSLSAPTGSGIYWDVFTYDAATGTLTITNKIVETVPSI